LGGIALKNAYDAYTERTNTDVSRATHVITEAGGYEYIYTVDQKMVTALKADAWSYTLLRGNVCSGGDILGACRD
jgi:hypothetical protein